MSEEYYEESDIIQKATEELKKLQNTVITLGKKPNPACFTLCASCQNHGRIVTKKVISSDISTRDYGIQVISYLLMLRYASEDEVENLMKELCALPVSIEPQIARA